MRLFMRQRYKLMDCLSNLFITPNLLPEQVNDPVIIRIIKFALFIWHVLFDLPCWKKLLCVLNICLYLLCTKTMFFFFFCNCLLVDELLCFLNVTVAIGKVCLYGLNFNAC